MRTLIIGILTVFGLAACAQSPDATGTQEVLRIVERGGCIRMGPNCVDYRLKSDGSYDLYRAGTDELAASGQVDAALLEAWLSARDNPDFRDQMSSLGKGECRACFDGVDVTYTFKLDGKTVEIDNEAVGFDTKLAFFQTALDLQRAMRTGADFEMKSH